MLNIIKKAGIINRANDEILYEYVLDEMEQGVRIKGIWAKALAHSDGMESKAESMYMQYRVQSIKDQFDALKIAYDEMSRKRLFDYIKNGFKEPVPEVKKIEKVEKVEKVKKIEKPQETSYNGEKAKQDLGKEKSSLDKEDSDKYDDYQSEITKLRRYDSIQESVNPMKGIMIGYSIFAFFIIITITTYISNN